MDIAKAITKARLAGGFSRQNEFAQAFGVHTSAISRWETGQSRPDDATITAMEKFLNLPKGAILISAGLVDVPGLVDRAETDEWTISIGDLAPRDRAVIVALIAAFRETGPRGERKRQLNI